MYITYVSLHPGFSSSPCTGHAPSLPSQLLGKKAAVTRMLKLALNTIQECSALLSCCLCHTYCSSTFVSVFLSQEANTSLVRACWNELFTLGLAQCAQVMNLSTILTAIINHLQSSIEDGMDHRPRHHLTVGHTHTNRSGEMCFYVNKSRSISRRKSKHFICHMIKK